MVKKTIQICNNSGLHLRPAGQLCQKALEYKSRIEMEMEGKRFNLKSMLSVLSAKVVCPREVQLICEGPDEQQALEDIAAFLSEDFG